jgi:rare lipoprotein A
VHALTAAHRTLPFGTIVRVTCLKSGKSVNVRINDRGPFRSGRIIDLSYEAARRLGIVSRGAARVELTVIG